MTMFRDLISKVRVDVNDKKASQSLAKDILDWVKSVSPIVVVGKQKKGADKWF